MNETKHLLKYFIIIFLISFVFFNWNKILLISNYRVIWHGFTSIFEEKKASAFKSNNADNSIDEQSLTNNKYLDKKDYFQKNNEIEIPKINVVAPLILPPTNEEKELENFLNSGTLLYPDFSKPGEEGQTIILGHSAPPGWPDINYDNIFSNLGELEKGDKIFVYYNHKKYTFEVFDKKIFYPSEEDKFLYPDRQDDSLLILLTCWPPGKDFKRLAIFARPLDKSF